MRLCIPVCQPNGLESMIEPHLPNAEHLLFFDLVTRQYEHVSLREQEAGAGMNIEMDAVLCGSINRMILRQLFEQGIKVYGVDTQTVAQAIARFENGELEAVVSGGHGHSGGGCCSGGGHGTEEHGCHGHASADAAEHACHGGGCQSHAPGHGGGCCGSHGQAAPAKARDKVVRIAVCSQNRKAVTEHAGKCRKFWIYEVSQGQVTAKTLLELPLEQSLHASPAGQAHPLDAVDVLICGGAGSGLTQRLAQLGIECVVTAETDLELAVAAYLAGSSDENGALN